MLHLKAAASRGMAAAGIINQTVVSTPIAYAVRVTRRRALARRGIAAPRKPVRNSAASARTTAGGVVIREARMNHEGNRTASSGLATDQRPLDGNARHRRLVGRRAPKSGKFRGSWNEARQPEIGERGSNTMADLIPASLRGRLD